MHLKVLVGPIVFRMVTRGGGPPKKRTPVEHIGWTLSFIFCIRFKKHTVFVLPALTTNAPLAASWPSSSP